MSELILQYLEEASIGFDLNMMKVDAFTEAAKRQFALNQQAAEIKVMQESGTDDDLRYLYEASDASFQESLKKSFSKIIEAFDNYYKHIQEKVSSLLQKEETKNSIENIMQQFKTMPGTSKMKVTISNTSAKIKACNEYLSKFAKLKSKAKSGQSVTQDDIDSVSDAFDNAFSAASKKENSATVNLNAAVAALKRATSNADRDVTSAYKDGTKVLNDAANAKPKTAEQVSILLSVAREYVQVAKTKMNIIIDEIPMLMRAVKSGFSGAKTTSEEKKPSFKERLQSLGKGKDKDTDVKESADETAPDSAEAQKALDDAIAKEEAPVNPINDPIDALDQIDPWADMLGGLDSIAPTPGAECGTECNVGENATDTFEVIYKKIFGDAALNPSDDAALTGGKPNNDKMIADLYKDVMAEVRGKNPEYKLTAPLKEGIGQESVFDTLMAQVENLF